ncbi:MAG: hypothetical protein Q9201_005670 [Fulgogasparrea decipioides]
MSVTSPELAASNPIKVGDSFPSDVKFTTVPYTPEKEAITSCGMPQEYDASKEFAGKKVVLFAVPGAFTPGCSVQHLPGYINHLEEIKSKGVDLVAVIAFNDAWVMSAWAKANKIKDEILFLSDGDAKFSKSIGWVKGERTGRYAIIIDHGKITYAENEPGMDVTTQETLDQPDAVGHWLALLEATILRQHGYQRQKEGFACVESPEIVISRFPASRDPYGFKNADMFRFHKSLDVITLFHKASSPASVRAHTLLKQISAHASENATEDQATDHSSHNKFQRTDFELNVTEDPPTSDQLRTILEYVGPGGGRAGQIVEGAADEADALKRLKEDPSRFKQPVVGLAGEEGASLSSEIVDWNNGRAGKLLRPPHIENQADRTTVFGYRESEIMKMISQLPRETD